MWPIVFISIEAICASYFLFAKRSLDLFTLANFAVAFYMLPLAVGFVPKLERLGASETERIALDPRLYVFGIALAVSTTLAAIAYDRFMAPGSASETERRRSFAGIFLLASIAGLALHVAGGGSIFLPNKQEMLRQIGYAFVLFETAMALSLVDAFYHRRYFHLAMAAVLLMVDVAAGFRFNAILIVLACGILTALKFGPLRLIKKTPLLGGAAVALLLFGLLVNPVRLYGPAKAFDMIFNDRAQQYGEFIRLEPFITQSLANEALRSDLSCRGYNWAQVAASILPLGKLLGVQPTTFEDEYNPLFPGITYGLAGNPWAEAYCRDGWVGFAVSVAGFISLLCLLQFLLGLRIDVLIPALALCGTIVAFYVHRNDFYFLFLLLRRISLVVIAAYLIDAAWRVATSRRSATLRPKLPTHST